MVQYGTPLNNIEFGPGSNSARQGVRCTLISALKYPQCYLRPKLDTEILTRQFFIVFSY